MSIAEIDLAGRRVVLEFTADTTVRRLRLEGVSSVVVERVGRDKWDYAEASEVGITNGNTLDIVLWDEPNRLAITFETAWIDPDGPPSSAEG